MNIGERIRARRLALGMSQQELAFKLGYKSRSSINKIELNARNITQQNIKAIADALFTTPEYIMGWDDLDEGEDMKKIDAKNGIYKLDFDEASMLLDYNNLTEEGKEALRNHVKLLMLMYQKKEE